MSRTGRLAWTGDWKAWPEDRIDTVPALELTSIDAYLWIIGSSGGIYEGMQPTYLGRRAERDSRARWNVSNAPVLHFLYRYKLEVERNQPVFL